VKSGHISVCICTYQRPLLLKRLLEKLALQRPGEGFTFSIVVADNDPGRSAENLVQQMAQRSSVRIIYCSEPRRNIALARNKTIEHADGEFIAFIDDDEFPADDWLQRLLHACSDFKASGVLGPVRPHFDTPPPRWILRGRFCERPEPPTGTVMHWTKSRTGNVLFRRSILDGMPEAFRPEFGTGGEDQDFFMRTTQRGCVFVWCNEAVAYETVPPSRWTRRYMLNRALLRGNIVLKHSAGRNVLVVKSLAAVPAYLLILPVTLLFGQHVFMKYGIKFCDHLGRLLALFRLNPVNERQM
jgi:glycosyltransferase involved in cell wall biosynthesis